MGTTEFEDFARAELPGLLRYATALAGDPGVAGDVVQEVLIRVHAKWRRLGALDHVDRYVRRMVTNEWLSHQRKWAQRMIVAVPDDELALRSPAQADVAAGHADREDLSQRLKRLSERQRTALVLRHYLGLDYAEIGVELRCAEVTARSLCSRGLAALRIDFTDDADTAAITEKESR